MTVDPDERRLILAQVERVAAQDLTGLWAKASALPSSEFREFMLDAFPEVATNFAVLAAETAATWYAASPSVTAYIPASGPLPVATALRESAGWALGATGEDGLVRMQGTLQRTIFDGARDAITFNVESEPGARWARHASSNACAFCALMATRGAVYTSKAAAQNVVGRRAEITIGDRRAIARGDMTREEAYRRRETYESARAAEKAGKSVGDVKARRERGKRKAGEKYHDHCHCIAVEVRPGQSYEPPAYVSDWEAAYRQAARKTPKTEDGAIDPTAVLAHMRTSLGTH